MTAPAILGEPLHELKVRVIGIREFRADAHGPVGEIAGAPEWLARRGQDQACHAVAFVGGPVVGAAPEPIEQVLACPAIGLLIADVGAELGIAVPGVELGRVVRQDLLPRDAGLLRPPIDAKTRARSRAAPRWALSAMAIRNASAAPARSPASRRALPKIERAWPLRGRLATAARE